MKIDISAIEHKAFYPTFTQLDIHRYSYRRYNNSEKGEINFMLAILIILTFCSFF